MKSLPNYQQLLRIPEGTQNGWEVRAFLEPAGPVARVSMRTAMMAGHHAKPLVYTHPTRWIELCENGKRWMSNLPIEQWQHRRQLGQMRGHVLIGGLGLGVMATLCACLDRVESITVIERSPEVYDLVWKHLRLRGKDCSLIQADLNHWARQSGTLRFDSAYLDIWTGDGQGQYLSETLPLIRACRRFVRGPIVAWNEDVMLGQFFIGLQSRLLWLTHPVDSTLTPSLDALATPCGDQYIDWSVPFFRYVRACGIESRSMSEWSQTAAHYVREFPRLSGDPLDRWEG